MQMGGRCGESGGRHKIKIKSRLCVDFTLTVAKEWVKFQVLSVVMFYGKYACDVLR